VMLLIKFIAKQLHLQVQAVWLRWMQKNSSIL